MRMRNGSAMVVRYVATVVMVRLLLTYMMASFTRQPVGLHDSLLISTLELVSFRPVIGKLMSVSVYDETS